MTMTKTSVFKMACGHLKQKPVGDADENSVTANYMNVYWDAAVDYVLERHDWGFARARGELSQVENDDLTDWSYQYSYPSDCVKPRALQTGVRVTHSPTAFKVELSADLTSKTIVCDLDEAWLIYTKRITNMALWPVSALIALSYKLAELSALLVTGKEDLKARCAKEYETAEARAKLLDSQNGQDDPEPDSQFIEARA